MLAPNYEQLKRTYAKVIAVAKEAIDAAQADVKAKTTAWEAALLKEAAAKGVFSGEGITAPLVSNDSETAKAQMEAAKKKLQIVEQDVAAMTKQLQEQVMPYFDLLDRAGLIPPMTSPIIRAGAGVGIVAAGAVVGGVTAYATTEDPTHAYTLAATAATALGITTVLTFNPEVFRELKMAAVAIAATFAANAVFTKMLTGDLTRESFNAGISPFLVALVLIDVIGAEIIKRLLAHSHLPTSANFGLRLILTMGAVLAGVVVGPGLTGGERLDEVTLFPAIPFAMATATKMSLEAVNAKRLAEAADKAPLPVIDVSKLTPVERVNYQNILTAAENLGSIVAEHQKTIPGLNSITRLSALVTALKVPTPGLMPEGSRYGAELGPMGTSNVARLGFGSRADGAVTDASRTYP